MSAAHDPATPALVIEGPSTPGPAVPDLLRVRIGPLRFSGRVVGPDHPYMLDCWVAVIGPTPVLCLARLHQLVGIEIDSQTVARSVGLGGANWQPRLGWCLEKLSRHRLLSCGGQLIELSPGIRILTQSELDFAGNLVRGLHAKHLDSARARRFPRPATGTRGAGVVAGERG